MRTLFFTALAALVLSLAFWAYKQNYATQEAIAEVEALQRQIAARKEALSVLSAEWAYLNRPERLAELVKMHAEALKLEPLAAEHFATIGQIALPDTQQNAALYGETGEPL